MNFFHFWCKFNEIAVYSKRIAGVKVAKRNFSARKSCQRKQPGVDTVPALPGLFFFIVIKQ